MEKNRLDGKSPAWGRRYAAVRACAGREAAGPQIPDPGRQFPVPSSQFSVPSSKSSFLISKTGNWQQETGIFYWTDKYLTHQLHRVKVFFAPPNSPTREP